MTVLAKDLLLHCGESMHPVLIDGDLLETEPLSHHPAIGDVIVFHPPDHDALVVHRVSAVVPGGIRTRGDKHDSDDPWTLPAGTKVRRVTALHRDGRREAVACGSAGRRQARRARLRRRVIAPLEASRLLRFLESTAGRLARLLPPALRPRIVDVSGESGTSRKLVLGRRVIGRYDESLGKWRVRRRYRWLAASRITPGEFVN